MTDPSNDVSPTIQEPQRVPENTDSDTQVVDEELDDILSGFAMHASWWGFDKAMDTEGKHTSSTRTEALDAAKQAIETWHAQQLVKELERLNFQEASGFLSGGTRIVRQGVVTKRIDQLKHEFNLNPKESEE